jgi:hypothetical protein
MKTQQFLIGLCIGLLAGILLMLAFSQRYALETGAGQMPLMRINTMTGQTWIIDQGQAGYYWKPLG